MPSILTLDDGDWKVNSSGQIDPNGTQVYTGTYSGTYCGETVSNKKFTTYGPDLVDYVWSGSSFTPVVRATFTEKVKKKVVLSLDTTHHLVVGAPYVEPEPVVLPAYTMRFKFSNSSYDPTQVSGWKSGSTWTQVTNSTDNLWDYTHVSSNWDDEFNAKFTNANNVVDIIAVGDMSGVTSMANVAYVSSKVAGGVFGSGNASATSYVRSIVSFDTSNVTNMDGMFFHCTSMTSCPPLDTSKCTSFWSMFDSCTGLRWVNGLDFSSATSVRAIFANCNLRKLPDMSTITTRLTACQFAFQHNMMCGEYGSPGILDAYNNLRRGNPSTFTGCFTSCGTSTTDGRAEYNQIPSNWGGGGP